MQGNTRELARTQKNSTNIVHCSLCLVLIGVLLLGFRIKVKERNNTVAPPLYRISVCGVIRGPLDCRKLGKMS